MAPKSVEQVLHEVPNVDDEAQSDELPKGEAGIDTVFQQFEAQPLANQFCAKIINNIQCTVTDTAKQPSECGKRKNCVVVGQPWYHFLNLLLKIIHSHPTSSKSQ